MDLIRKSRNQPMRTLKEKCKAIERSRVIGVKAAVHSFNVCYITNTEWRAELTEKKAYNWKAYRKTP